MRRRRFLKAVFGGLAAAAIPIPVPAGPKPLTMEVICEATKRVVEKGSLDYYPTPFGYTPAFDLDYSFTGTLKHESGLTRP